MPILLRQRLDGGGSVEPLADLGASEDKGTSISRIVWRVRVWPNSPQTSCVERDRDTLAEGTLDRAGSAAGGSVPTSCGQACIQADSPWRRNKVKPQERLIEPVSFRAVRRRSSYPVIHRSPLTSVATSVRSVAPFFLSVPEPVRCCGDAPSDADAGAGVPPIASHADCCRPPGGGR